MQGGEGRYWTWQDPYCFVTPTVLQSPAEENETSRKGSRDASRVRQHEKYCFSSLQITIHIISSLPALSGWLFLSMLLNGWSGFQYPSIPRS